MISMCWFQDKSSEIVTPLIFVQSLLASSVTALRHKLRLVEISMTEHFLTLSDRPTLEDQAIMFHSSAELRT